jgi:Fe-S-cluster containining protein
MHIKEEHPKKFKYLRNNKPELYKRLQKEFEVYEMIQSKDPNLFTLDVNNEKQYFRYHCVRCGKCCHIWEIEIIEEDLENWSQEKRIELLEYIQIYPKSISVMNLGLIQNLAEIEVSEISLDQISFVSSIFNRERIDANALLEEIISREKEEINDETRNKIKKILDIQNQIIGYYLTGEVKELDDLIISNIDRLRDFVLKNHNYLGEPKVDKWGRVIKDPTLEELKIKIPEYFDEEKGLFKGKIPHWMLGINYGPRAILSPKNFEVIKEGWQHNLTYYLIYELYGGCGFLKNNLCSIHEYKPLACKEFPFNRRRLSQEADSIFLQTCKGLKRIL